MSNSLNDRNEHLGAKIVAIGGGSGLSVILRGLKNISENITAVVTVADNGGGSGVLRADLGMLPPGDIRNCILALANKEPTLQELFNYRFTEGSLSGQSFGNLMIAAMVGIAGSFELAVKRVSEIFAITGEVIPVTLESPELVAELEDGTVVNGESEIPQMAISRKSSIKRIWQEPKNAPATTKVLERIREADIIVLGPGSLFTSIVPNLLVKEVVQAVNHSSAKVFYVANLMTQRGETDGFSPADHLVALMDHTGLEHVDFILINDEETGGCVEARYRKMGTTLSKMKEGDEGRIQSRGVAILSGEFLEVRQGYIVHDANAIAEAIVNRFDRVFR